MRLLLLWWWCFIATTTQALGDKCFHDMPLADNKTRAQLAFFQLQLAAHTGQDMECVKLIVAEYPTMGFATNFNEWWANQESLALLLTRGPDGKMPYEWATPGSETRAIV